MKNQTAPWLIVCAIVFALQVACASAATVGDSFLVGAIVNDDSTPPTVPSPVTATPVASSQIDVTWGASTDNTALGGYQLYRDGVQIATTSATTYSDTGLAASTTYAYYVIAFDIFENRSASSSIAATTTYAVPVIPPTPTSTPTGGGGATRTDLEVTSFSVVPGTESAVIAFTLTAPARYVIRYGESASYADGSLTTDRYARAHDTLLVGLRSNTRYEYEVLAYDRFGNLIVVKRDTFTTLALPDTESPTNVSGLTARAYGNDVLLSWNKPQEPDFSHVRIVRSHLFFPVDPNDGFVVYEGRAEEFRDPGALREYDRQYYTVFSYDSSGNRSSGAIVVAAKAGIDTVTPLPATTTATSGLPDMSLTPRDIEIVQDGSVFSITDLASELKPDRPWRIRIPYDRFPRHLKVITVTLTLPQYPERAFSFILRANEAFSYYEAALASLPDSGEYGLSVAVFDVKQNQIYETRGLLRVAPDTGSSSATRPVVSLSTTLTSVIPVFLGLLALFIFLFLVLRRRGEDNDTHKTE